jgi:hypothetical protein
MATEMRRDACEFLVMRIRDILGYVEYFGPMVSCVKDCKADAERLYGKPGYRTKTLAWSKASQRQKDAAAANPDNTFR